MNIYEIWSDTLDFNSRLRRKEYFLFIISMGLIALTADIVLTYLITKLDSSINPMIFVNTFSFIFYFPIFTAQVRRLHDTGRRGWWLLVPFVGFVFTFFKSVEGDKDWSWRKKET